MNLTFRIRRPASAPLVLLASCVTAAFTIQPAFAQEWQDDVNQIIGWEGEKMPDNVLRFTLTPHLSQQIAGVRVFENLTLDGYAAFHAEGSQALMVAEIVAQEQDAPRVVDTAKAQGLSVSAVHNHTIREQPRIIYVHMSGFGDPVQLARSLKTTIGAARLSLHTDEDQEDADDTAPGLNVGELEGIMQTSSKAVDGVLEFTFDRPESYTLDGHALPPAMGPESEVHLQSIGEGRAMLVAEIALLPAEVQEALQVLHSAGMQTEVSALHNHFTTEEPRLFFLHTVGVGNPAELARTIHSVIDKTPQQ